jgi:hypothetical protein
MFEAAGTETEVQSYSYIYVFLVQGADDKLDAYLANDPSHNSSHSVLLSHAYFYDVQCLALPCRRPWSWCWIFLLWLEKEFSRRHH